jgi:hypothetical protein
MSMEIQTNKKVSVTPYVVYPITKPFSLLKGGIGLEIMPLPFQTFTIHVLINSVVCHPMEGSERSDKK